jgi:hypothetical protein
LTTHRRKFKGRGPVVVQNPRGEALGPRDDGPASGDDEYEKNSWITTSESEGGDISGEDGEDSQSERSNVDDEIELGSTAEQTTEITNKDSGDEGMSSPSDFPGIANLVSKKTTTATRCSPRQVSPGSPSTNTNRNSGNMPLVPSSRLQSSVSQPGNEYHFETDDISDDEPLFPKLRARKIASQRSARATDLTNGESNEEPRTPHPSAHEPGFAKKASTSAYDQGSYINHES